MDVTQRIQEQLKSNPVVLYMKGTPDFPQCGFSASAVRTLDEIARWGRMSAAEQWQIIARLERVRQQEVATASPVPAN